MTALLRALPMPAQDLLDEWFESEPLKAAIASTAVQNLRQGPRSGGTSLVLMHHLVGAPAGSMRRAGSWANAGIVAALEDAARRNGATIRTNTRVERIQIADEEIRGVVLENGEELSARTVLSSADASRTMLGMVDPVWLDPEFIRAIGNIKYRGSTAFVVYGLDRLVGLPGGSNLPQLLSGIVSLTPSRDALEHAYDAAKYGRVSDRPHVEVTIPTIAEPRHAPNGKHVLVARVQYAPYRLRDGDKWDSKRRDALAAHVTTAISAAIPRFEDFVLQRTVFSPTDVEKLFGSTEGAAHQGELMLDQFLFMRPVPGWAHYRMPVEGLYLGGSGTHPGHGVIGGCGYNAAQQVIRDLSRGPARRGA
jgi:phytoene dehydrogenase-like protein